MRLTRDAFRRDIDRARGAPCPDAGVCSRLVSLPNSKGNATASRVIREACWRRMRRLAPPAAISSATAARVLADGDNTT